MITINGLAEQLGLTREEVALKVSNNVWGLGEAVTVVRYCKANGHAITLSELDQEGLVRLKIK